MGGRLAALAIGLGPVLAAVTSQAASGGWQGIHIPLYKPGIEPVVAAIVIDPLQPLNVYAGTDDYGLFKSSDGGRTFRLLRENFPSGALAIDPKKPRIIYEGSPLSTGLWKTSDRGRTWSPILDHAVATVAVTPTNPATVYAGGEEGVWRTTNGGASWQVVSRGIPKGFEVFSIAVDPTRADTLYLAAGEFGSQSGSLFKSDDGAKRWQRLKVAADVEVLAINPAAPSVVYAGGGDGVEKSVDGGKSWNAVDGLAGKDVRALAVDPRTPTTLYAGTRGNGDQNAVFRSTDSGKSWRSISRGLPDNDVHALAVSRTGWLYAGTYHGIFRAQPSAALYPTTGPVTGPTTLNAGKVRLSPAYAGRIFTASIVVIASDTHKGINGLVSCVAHIGGRVVELINFTSSASGTATCTWRLPKAARSKTITGTITVDFFPVGGSRLTAKRSFTALIH